MHACIHLERLGIATACSGRVAVTSAAVTTNTAAGRGSKSLLAPCGVCGCGVCARAPWISRSCCCNARRPLALRMHACLPAAGALRMSAAAWPGACFSRPHASIPPRASVRFCSFSSSFFERHPSVSNVDRVAGDNIYSNDDCDPSWVPRSRSL